MDVNDESLVLSVPAVARLLSISKATCYAACRSGQIRTLRFGKRIVIPKIGLERLLAGEALESNCASSTDDLEHPDFIKPSNESDSELSQHH